MDCINFETVLNDFVTKKKIVTQNIFPLLSKAFWLRINYFHSLRFSNLKQKEYSIIISSPMGSMYIETPYILTSNAFEFIIVV